MSRMLVLPAAVLFAILLPGPVLACQCAPQPPPKVSAAQAVAVFVGRVLTIEDSEYGYVVTFRVVESWKGVETREIDVLTGFGRGDCGFKFELKKSYLVYAYGQDRLMTGVCSRTQKLKRAKGDLKELGKGRSFPP
jgi:hypothetical protein